MKAAVEQVQREYAFSQRRACALLRVAVSSCRYRRDVRMSRCERNWWSWRGRSRALVIAGCMCCWAAPVKP